MLLELNPEEYRCRAALALAASASDAATTRTHMSLVAFRTTAKLHLGTIRGRSGRSVAPFGLATTLHLIALRCLYTDLDGTLLGKFGSLFADAEGNFSRNQALMIEACHRAEVEIVVMSGRREAQVLSDSRLMGQTSYIYEAGCGMVIDREKTFLTGEGWVPDENGNPAQRMIDSGIPDLLFERFPGRLEWHAPWHEGRELSLLFRGKIDVDETNTLIAERGEAGRDLRFLDNGAIGRPMEGIEVTHAYHLVPGGASKGKAVDAHMRARGYLPQECIAAGDSIEDLGTAEYVGRFFCMANGHERDEALRGSISAYDNVTVTEGQMGDGVYEAVVSTLAGG
jgi:hydroxymethylpyrimidine pyrophosphatase-like HAD family hydrolase